MKSVIFGGIAVILVVIVIIGRYYFSHTMKQIYDTGKKEWNTYEAEFVKHGTWEWRSSARYSAYNYVWENIKDFPELEELENGSKKTFVFKVNKTYFEVRPSLDEQWNKIEEKFKYIECRIIKVK